MSNYSDDNSINREREEALKNNNLYFAGNKMKNLHQRREQKVPTPEPRRRLAHATGTTITTTTIATHQGSGGKLENELAIEDHEQQVKVNHYTQPDNNLRVSTTTNTSHTMEALGHDRLTRATHHRSPTETPADEGVGSPTVNVGFDDYDDDDDVNDDDDDDEDHIRLAEGDDDELVDEYYDQETTESRTKLPIDQGGANGGLDSHLDGRHQLTNLSRQSMVPIHELIAYYQYIQNGNPQPQSLDRETSTTSNTTTTTFSGSTSASTSRQSSSASQQTARSKQSMPISAVDATDAGAVCEMPLQTPTRVKRSIMTGVDDYVVDGDDEDLQMSDCQGPKILVESVASTNQDDSEHKPAITQDDVVEPQHPAPPKVQDRTRLRANVVLELINSERDFVKHLKNVVEGYLHRARKHPEIFTAQQINTIFANIEQLYKFQRQFLEELEHCINWSDLAQSQVGQCFLRYEKGFSVYHYYCNNHPNATSELQDLHGKSIFRSFFEECRLRQNMIDISLDGFLLTPIQKICKYPLQLNELLKNTSNTHPDYQDVSSALESMRNCANLANERKRRIEALADVMSFQEKVDNWYGQKLSDTSSILVHSGEVSKMASHTWSQGVQLHLFDHLLLYSKRDLLKRNNLILKGRICMDTVTEISDADEYKPRKSFKLYCSEQQKWFVFTTKSEREKDEWIRAFERERNLVESDENEGFHITDRELGIARRALLHRKRSRSARYRHQHNNVGKRPDTALVGGDQLEPDDGNLMINRTLSLPSCIHPSHVMNFVEDSRVVSNSSNSNSSTRKKNASSPNSNSRGSPMASSQHLANNSAYQSEHPDQASQQHQSGPGNWLRKMGSKKLTRGQVYQINGQTGQQQHAPQMQTIAPGGIIPKPVATVAAAQQHANDGEVDAAALKYDELEKRHRDHMVSEQQARLYRLNNDLPPPPTLYPRSLTPIPFVRSGSGDALVADAPATSGIQSSQGPISNSNNRPKSSPSHHHLHSAGLSPPHPANTNLASSSSASILSASLRNESTSSSSAAAAAAATATTAAFQDKQQALESQFKESLNLNKDYDHHHQYQQQQRQQQQSPSQPAAASTFETQLVLSSGRIVHVREDAV